MYDKPSIVTGVMDVYSFSARVLIDLGATHSFINNNFDKRLNMTPTLINSWFSVSTPSTTVMESKSSLKPCLIRFGEYALFIDLIDLCVHDFDVIFGIDLLSKYQVNINCHEKEVVIQPLNKQSFNFIDIKTKLYIPFISTMKAP